MTDLKCPVCEGKGARLNGILPCFACHGTGKQTVEQFIAEVEKEKAAHINPAYVATLISLLRASMEDGKRFDRLLERQKNVLGWTRELLDEDIAAMKAQETKS